MKFSTLLCSVLLLQALTLPATAREGQSLSAPDLKELNKLSRRYVPTALKVDVSGLSTGDRRALVKLIEAAHIVDSLFMKQMWEGNAALQTRLEKDNTPTGRSRLHYFQINKAPWSELDDYRAFLPGVPERKPPGAGFYPPGMTKADFESWTAGLTPPEQKEARSFFTVIRRNPDNSKSGSYICLPYSRAYEGELKRLSDLLRQAAELSDNATLKKFLKLRADAFLSNDYYESDSAWMDLDAPLDITIGPYETYNDELFGYKAAFEAYINLRDDNESKRLSAFSRHLQEIENNLPLADVYKNTGLGAGASIRVVDEIISAGDGAHGVQSAAYNLPNDERVLLKKGSKRVLLKNVQAAKFKSVLLPIARKTLPAADLNNVSFTMFFTHILAHELMHGLGPHHIKASGRDTTVREELKDVYSAIEESKADVTGLFALQYLMDQGSRTGLDKILPGDEKAQKELYTTYLASMFRSLRFGLSEAHGKGTALQLNFFLDKGAVIQNADNTFSIDMSKIKQAVQELDHILLTIEAQGDYAGARDLLTRLSVLRPPVRKALDNLEAIPSDIEPLFVTAGQLQK